MKFRNFSHNLCKQLAGVDAVSEREFNRLQNSGEFSDSDSENDGDANVDERTLSKSTEEIDALAAQMIAENDAQENVTTDDDNQTSAGRAAFVRFFGSERRVVHVRRALLKANKGEESLEGYVTRWNGLI